MRILLVTNDFPPRVGGIQNYLWNIYARLAPDDLVVLAPAHPGDVAFDRAQAFEIVRWPGRVYWPTGALTRRVREVAAARDVDAVAFGAVLPMNLMAGRIGRPAIVHTNTLKSHLLAVIPAAIARVPLSPDITVGVNTSATNPRPVCREKFVG